MYVGCDLKRALPLPGECVETQLLVRLLDSLRAAAFLVDLDDRTLLACNASAERVFGYPPEAIVGKRASILHVDRAHFADFEGRCTAMLGSDRPFHARSWMRRADGRSFRSEHTVTPATDVSGRRVAVSTVRDLSDDGDHAFVKTYARLTAREQEVFVYTAEGCSAKQAARALGLSHRTVEIHRARILQKFDVRTTKQLLAELALASVHRQTPPQNTAAAA